MKTTLFVLLVSFAINGIASAGQFGPTEPIANQGKVSLGMGYFFEEMQWKSDVFGNFRTQSNQGYIQLSYGIAKSWEVYGRIGGADWETRRENGPDFRDDVKSFGAMGFKGLFYHNTIFGFGAFAQGTYYSEYKDSAIAPARLTNGITIPNTNWEFMMKNYYDVNAGLSVQAKFRGFIAYGGGFWYMSRAKAEGTKSGVVPGTSFRVTSDFEDTIKEKNYVDGFLGVKIPVAKQIGLNLEGQIRDRVSGGAILSYSF